MPLEYGPSQTAPLRVILGRMEVKRYHHIYDLTCAAAESIFDDCLSSLATRASSYTIGVSGGRTPPLMFEALTNLPIPWSRVHVCQVDERVAPAASDDRNFSRLTEHLLAHVEIPSNNVHPMPVETGDLASACRQYEDELRSVTRGAPFDLLQLGLGDDGHTASLAPEDPILGMTDRDVWYVENYKGLARMSMTLPIINRAHRVLWLAAGASKAEMVSRLLASDRTIPAGRVCHDRAVLLVDTDAGIHL